MKKRLIQKGFLVLAPAVLFLLAIPMHSQSGSRREQGEKESGNAKLKVFVSIIPQAYFVERVVGNRVDVQVLVQPGHSPATYEPTPKQMARLSEADVFFRISVPFENVLIPMIESTK